MESVQVEDTQVAAAVTEQVISTRDGSVLEKKTILPFLPISLVLLALDPIIGR
jgi:hypothetical protein